MLMSLYQPSFGEPIRSHGSLFLCYCFIASIQTAEQAQAALAHSISKGWVTSSAAVKAPSDVIIHGLCHQFHTPRVESVHVHQLSDDHWVVVNPSGDVLFDPQQPPNNDQEDPETTEIATLLFENDVVDRMEMQFKRPLSLRKATKIKVDGGVWVSGKADDVLFSAYYHPTRRHCATVKSGVDGRIHPGVKEWVEPGQWAVAYAISRADSGNEGHYELEDAPAQTNIYRDYPTDLLKGIDVHSVIDRIAAARGTPLINRKATKRMADGGVWVCGRADDVLFSAFFHNSRRHRVFVRPGAGAGLVPQDAEWTKPGEWSFAWADTTASSGNKAIYEVE